MLTVLTQTPPSFSVIVNGDQRWCISLGSSIFQPNLAADATRAYIELRMTQTANRAPQQGATVPQGACTRGAAGTGAPASTKIIPLPVYHGDVRGSLLGTMLFPNDAAKAEGYCARLLTKGPMQEYRRAGHTLSFSREITLFNALGREISGQEIETK